MKLKKITAYITCLLLIINAVFSFDFRVKADSNTLISYSFSSSNIQAGQTFDITVNAANITNLYGASVDFYYDPTAIQITGVDQGAIFKNSGKSVNAMTPTNDSTNGVISFTETLQSNISGLAVGSTNSLFVIHAKALKAATTPINTISDNINNTMSASGNNMCIKLSDSNGQAVSYSARSGTISINDVISPSIDSFTADKTSPQVSNTAVNLIVSASGGTSLLYQFWAFDGTNWTLIKDYSSSYTATWTPTVAGSYTLYVNVKDSKSTKSYDTFKTIN
ncbi:MAG: cohesin domain-containing protein, partial [Bacillota bacterium]|nr:cohesin domain-containing protein [Bacillota bacterium]